MSVPTKFIVEFYELNGQGDRSKNGYSETKVASTLDDVAAFISDMSEASGERRWAFDVREVEVVA